MFTPADDLFHQPRFAEPAWTETNYFCFYQPELRRVCYVYLATKPNLGVAAYQVFVFRGFPRSRADFEYWDAQLYAPLPLANLNDITLNGALRIRVVEPLSRYRIDYDAGAGTSLHVDLEAISTADALMPIQDGQGFSQTFSDPYAALQDTGHLEQSMIARGTLILNGEQNTVDSACSRDHSWSVRADVINRPWPHSSWDTGHFDDRSCFRVMGRITEPHTVQCFAGWIVEEGKSFPLVAAAGRYERDGMMPRRIFYEVTDSRGKEFVFNGDVVALCDNVSPYLNVVSPCGLVRWDYDGQIGYGDVQNTFHLGAAPAAFFT